MFYWAMGDFISYMPYTFPTKPLSSGLGSDSLEPSATSLDDHRRTAVVIQQAVQQRFAEQFFS